MGEDKVQIDTIYVGDLSDYDIQDDSISLSLKMDVVVDNSRIAKVDVNSDTNKVVNNVPVNEGDLYALVRADSPKYFNMEINKNGELIIHGENADNYSIDDNGCLIYTEN